MKNKKSHEEFIKEITLKHPNLKVIGNYINNGTPILVKDIFEIKYLVYPGNLLKGKYPSLDSAIDKTEAFKIKLKKEQPELNVLSEYINSSEKILISDKLGIEYLVQPKKVLYGDTPSIKSAKNYNQAFILKSKSIHGNKYNYHLVKYINNSKKVRIACIEHGVFEQTPGNHLSGKGCPECKRQLALKRGMIKLEKRSKTIVDDIRLIHGLNLNFDRFVYIGARKKSLFGCNVNLKHDYWEATPDNILKGKGCPICKLSKGELQIKKLLTENNIKFMRQHKFSDCKNKLPLPFDFYLPNQNMCIEFNGRQHYEPVAIFGGEDSFKKTLKNDKIKKNYCKENDIKLITIKYLDFKNIDYILKENLLSI